MNGILIIAAALPVLFGVAIAASSIADRRRTLLRQRISHSIGMYTAPAVTALNLPLDAAKENLSPALRWLPLSVAKQIEVALGATGDRITVRHLLLTGSVAGALVLFLIERLLSPSPILALPMAAAAALAAPFALVRHAQGRFQTIFLNAFPDALDLIVRAVRAGLPLADAIETVGEEISGPVGAEFRNVHDGVTIGLELEQELIRAAERIRAVEFRFFIVALSLQRRTGGNLAETLENLSLTIRRRKEMWLKARAVMSESRASAWLIGLMPFISGGAIYFLSPNYMQMLLADPRGKMILGAALLSVATGAFIMRTMIKGAMR